MAKAIIDTLSKYPKGKKLCTVICISPIRIAHGKKERMRTSTDFCVNFIQRDETSQE